MNCTELQIQSGNIFGLFRNINGFIYNKLNEPEFVQQTKKTNILGLIETHHIADDIDQLQLFRFKCYQACRKKKEVWEETWGHSSFCP